MLTLSQWLTITGGTSLLICLFLLARSLLWRHMRAAWSYAAGILLVCGMLIPLRPALPIALLAPLAAPVASTRADMQSAPALPYGTSTEALLRTAPVIAPLAADAAKSATPGQHAQPAGQNSRATLGLLGGIWLGGATLFIAVQAARHARFARMVRRWRSAPTPRETVALSDTCAAMGIAKPPALWRCSFISTPMLVGLVRPAILMPEGDQTATALPLIFRHELTHYRRRDIWLKLPVLAALCLHWYNPLLWLLARAISADCEIACDDAVLSGMNMAVRQEYTRTILNTMTAARMPHVALSTSLHAHKTDVKRRFWTMLNTKRKKIGSLLVITTLALLLMTGSVFGAAPDPANISPTTGLAYPEGRDNGYRPVLVQLDDYSLGGPSYSISQADVVYQHLFWGPDHTRYVGLFNDYHPEMAGNLRSIRQYTADLRQEWDCPIVYAGEHKYNDVNSVNIAEDDSYIRALGVTPDFLFNSVQPSGHQRAFLKAPDRAEPYNIMADLSAVLAMWPTDGDGMPYVPRPPAFRFSENHTSSDDRASTVSLYYDDERIQDEISEGAHITYEYDEALKAYRRYIDGEPHLDGLTGDAVTARNIIVQRMPLAYGNNSMQNPLYTTYGTSGPMHAYINGRHIEGTWRRDDVGDQTHYYDGNGRELLLAPGKTFVQVLSDTGSLPQHTGSL